MARQPARLLSKFTSRDAITNNRKSVGLFAPCLAGLPGAFASTVALLPIHDANGRLLDALATRPKWPKGVYAAVLAIDPFHDIHRILAECRKAGVDGVANFPSVAVVDGQMRATLEELGLGYAREVAFIKAAAEARFHTAALVNSAEEARSMVSAGSRQLVAWPGSEDEDDDLVRVAGEADVSIAWLVGDRRRGRLPDVGRHGF